MKIRFLGTHNCESQGTKLLSLLVDERLVLDAGGLTSSLSFEAQLRLEAILLSHAHYDHIRDIPLIAMNLYLSGAGINVYATPSVRDALLSHLLNGQLYPNFLEKPEANPTIKFNTIEPYRVVSIAGYRVLAVPTNHTVPTVGYQITSAQGRVFFYTGDTGPGLDSCWRYVSPELLITEVTASNRFEQFGRESLHLTPSLLREELLSFQEINGYLPRVVCVHMSPNLEREIAAEIAALARELNCSITLAHEGMELNL